MDEQQLHDLKTQLDHYIDRFAPLFGRCENQAHLREFIQGLLLSGQRRNCENIAENIQGANVRTLQAFITTGAWDDAPILKFMRQLFLEQLADDDAVWNSDETGIPKQGTHSVGVARQYSGTLGRVDNCQIAVFANYCSTHGHTFMDRRLYLPTEWVTDAKRRQKAGVPEAISAQSKPELALEMIEQAIDEGIPFRWIGGDCVYGNSLKFVQGVRSLVGKWYVLDCPSNASIWTEEPQVIAAADRPKPKRGRTAIHPLVVEPTTRADEVIAALPESAWQRIELPEGSQGPRYYDYAEVTVWFSEDGLPGPAERLLVQRRVGSKDVLRYHRSNAPSEVSLAKLASVRGSRWSIEEDIKSCKGECGLDEYETRGWRGWHHHTTLSMLALAFLVLQKRHLGEKIGIGECSGGACVTEAFIGSAFMGCSGDIAWVGMAS